MENNKFLYEQIMKQFLEEEYNKAFKSELAAEPLVIIE